MIKEKIAKFLDVKSFVTILFTVTFVILLLKGDSIPQELMTIYTVIISFYFGTQAVKSIDRTSDKDKGDK